MYVCKMHTVTVAFACTMCIGIPIMRTPFGRRKCANCTVGVRTLQEEGIGEGGNLKPADCWKRGALIYH